MSDQIIYTDIDGDKLKVSGIAAPWLVIEDSDTGGSMSVYLPTGADAIDMLQALGRHVGCPVVPVSALLDVIQGADTARHAVGSIVALCDAAEADPAPPIEVGDRVRCAGATGAGEATVLAVGTVLAVHEGWLWIEWPNGRPDTVVASRVETASSPEETDR